MNRHQDAIQRFQERHNRGVCDDRPQGRRRGRDPPRPPNDPNYNIMLICLLILLAVIIFVICIWDQLSDEGFSALTPPTKHGYHRPESCPKKTKTGRTIPTSPPTHNDHNFDVRLKRLEEHYNIVSFNLNEIEQKIQKQIEAQETATIGQIPEQILQQIMDVEIGKNNGVKLTLRNMILTIIENGYPTSNSDSSQSVPQTLAIITKELDKFKDKLIICDDPDAIPGEWCIPTTGHLNLEELRRELTHFIVNAIKKENNRIPPHGDVGNIVSMAIAKYNADKTGLPDLALESSGGSIVNSCRDTKYTKKKYSKLNLFGFSFWSPPNTPRVIIQPGAIPGDCFSFESEIGIVIKLMGPGFITGFTIEHIPKSISPNGEIKSAPREFQVSGLLDYSNPKTGFHFGNYTYLDNNEPIQTFPVQHVSNTLFPYIELRVKNNHGEDFTCLYRFRVHGSLIHPNDIQNQNLVNFNRTCSENCIFQPKNSKSFIHLSCSEENMCKCKTCGCDCPGDIYQVEESNGKCIIEHGGPCGTDNGLEISCDSENECIRGICTSK